MRTPKLSALVFGLALATAACGDSKSSLNPTAPSSLSPDSLSVQSGAAVESGSMAKPANPGNGNGKGNGNGNGNENGNRGGNGNAEPRTPTGGDLPPGHSRVQIEGLISAVGSASVTVNGQLVAVTPDTVIRHGNRRFQLADLKAGDRVHVVAARVQNGTGTDATLEALEVKLQNPGEGDEAGEGEEPPPPPTGLVSVAALDDAASEFGNDTASFRFTRTGDLSLLSAPLTVTFSLTGTASNGVDYQNVPLSVTFPANEATVDLVITPIPDTAVEGDESVELTLVDTAPYELGSPIAATVTISDPPEPTVSVAAAQSPIARTGGFGIFVLTRTGDLSSALSVGVSTTGPYATQVPSTILFAAGQDTASALFVSSGTAGTMTMTIVDGAGYAVGTPSATIVVQ